MIEAEVKAIEAFQKTKGGKETRLDGQRKKHFQLLLLHPRKGSPPKRILSLIEKARQGISIDQMMKQTNLERLTVNGVLNRMKKEGRVKAKSRGVYVKA